MRTEEQEPLGRKTLFVCKPAMFKLNNKEENAELKSV